MGQFCTVCGAPLENGVCPVCGAQAAGQEMQPNTAPDTQAEPLQPDPATDLPQQQPVPPTQQPQQQPIQQPPPVPQPYPQGPDYQPGPYQNPPYQQSYQNPAYQQPYQPQGQPGMQGPYQQPAPYAPGFGMQPLKTNGPALASFILGLISIFWSFWGLMPIAAVICGIVGLSSFKPQIHKQRWMAVTGLVLGIIDLLYVIFALLAAVMYSISYPVL